MTWIRSFFILLIVVMFVTVSYSGTVSRVTKPTGTTAWVTGDDVTAIDLNGDFDAIFNVVNGGINDDNISGITTTEITAGCAGGGCSNPLGPQDLDDYSEDEDEADNVATPGTSETPSFATTMEGEVTRLRYAIRRLAIGDDVYRDNGALDVGDWWELPARGPNLVLNPSFYHDDDEDGTADSWTLEDGGVGGGPTALIGTNSQAEGYGQHQEIQAAGIGDGISQAITRLKASTLYLIVVRLKVTTTDTTEFTTSGALAASEWDDIVTARSIDFTSASYVTKGAVVMTDTTPTNITISLLSTHADDVFWVADVGMYELSTEVMPFQYRDFSSHTTVSAKQDCAGAPAYVEVTSLAKTIVVPGPNYTVSVDATVSLDDGSGGTNYETACQIKEDDVVVAGPVSGYLRSTTSESVSMHYVNSAPTGGASLDYTVECYCPDNSLDFQGNIAGSVGQTTSELSVQVQHN